MSLLIFFILLIFFCYQMAQMPKYASYKHELGHLKKIKELDKKKGINQNYLLLFNGKNRKRKKYNDIILAYSKLDCNAMVFCENNYQAYTNEELREIAKAGHYKLDLIRHAFFTFCIPALELFALYSIWWCTSVEISESAFFGGLIGFFSSVIVSFLINIKNLFIKRKRSGLSDSEVIENPAAFREYAKSQDYSSYFV